MILNFKMVHKDAQLDSVKREILVKIEISRKISQHKHIIMEV